MSVSADAESRKYPHQLLGLEVNQRAALIADLILWIGYLRWHFKTRGDAQPPVPVIRSAHNIKEADALVIWSRCELIDEHGTPITVRERITAERAPFGLELNDVETGSGSCLSKPSSTLFLRKLVDIAFVKTNEADQKWILKDSAMPEAAPCVLAVYLAVRDS
jgi:hypothetical protein